MKGHCRFIWFICEVQATLSFARQHRKNILISLSISGVKVGKVRVKGGAG